MNYRSEDFKLDIMSVVDIHDRRLINDHWMTRLIEIYSRKFRDATLNDRELKILETFERLLRGEHEKATSRNDRCCGDGCNSM